MFHLTRIFLTVFAVPLLLLWVGPAAAEGAPISPPEASALVAQGRLTLIDLRAPEEWRLTGVPAGAQRVEMRNSEGTSAFLEQVLAVVHGDKSSPIALICRTGRRSAQAQTFLSAQGFTNVVEVGEGVMGNDSGPGWLQRGLPISPCPDC